MKKIIYLISFVSLFNTGWGQGCDDVEVELWGECYNIKETIELNLFDSELSGEIPPEKGNLINLTQLNLSYNQFTGEIPSLENLSSLQYLDLRNHNLNSLESTNNLISLEYLYLSYNLIDNFPESIYSIPNLKELYISNNYISSIAEMEQTCSFF